MGSVIFKRSEGLDMYPISAKMDLIFVCLKTAKVCPEIAWSVPLFLLLNPSATRAFLIYPAASTLSVMVDSEMLAGFDEG